MPELTGDRAEHPYKHYQLVSALEPKATKRFLHAIRKEMNVEHVGHKIGALEE